MDGIGIAAVGIGGIFVWGGIKGFSPLKAAENIVKGENPNSSQTNANTMLSNQNALSAAGFGNQPSATIPQNIALGQMMAASYGWTGQKWTDLQSLWQRESGWSQFAENPTSGAYGIPQALPPTKMPASAQASGGSNVQTQIAWGLQYIKGQYGDPTNALAHENANGWY